MKPSSQFNRIRLSISARLTLWYGLTLFILLSVFALFCYSTFHYSVHRDYDRHLTHEQRELMQYVRHDGTQPSFASLGELRSVAYQTDGIYGTYVRLVSTTGEELYRSPNLLSHTVLPFKAPRNVREFSVSRVWDDKPSRTLFTPLYDDNKTLSGWLEITGIEWSLHQELTTLGRALILGIIVSMVFSIGGGYLLARGALRPVAALTDSVKRIRATDLAARLPTGPGVRDELTDLAETFNEMIGRLESSFNRERRFTSNAAHELLTPLTTLRNTIDVTLARARDPIKYQQTLKTALVDVDQMSDTVKSLLRLSQAERLAGQPGHVVNLSKVVDAYVQRFESRIPAPPNKLSHQIQQDLFVTGDATLLREALDNLIENSQKYSPSDSNIDLKLDRVGVNARLRVSDDGIGFSATEANQLFDRFYRADSSSVGAQAGSGLGLTIVRTIVQSYGGTITAHSDGPNSGSTFEVLIPLVEST